MPTEVRSATSTASASRFDFVVANANGNTVSVFIGKGDGTFYPRVDYTEEISANSTEPGHLGS